LAPSLLGLIIHMNAASYPMVCMGGQGIEDKANINKDKVKIAKSIKEQKSRKRFMESAHYLFYSLKPLAYRTRLMAGQGQW